MNTKPQSHQQSGTNFHIFHYLLLLLIGGFTANTVNAANGWVYTDTFPWVYSSKESKWYYCFPDAGAVWMFPSDGGEVERMGIASPRAFSPSSFPSGRVTFNTASGTFPDDVGSRTVFFENGAYPGGTYSYEQVDGDTGVISYSSVSGYSGEYQLEFESALTGTFTENYTGPFTGVNSGTFSIVYD